MPRSASNGTQLSNQKVVKSPSSASNHGKNDASPTTNLTAQSHRLITRADQSSVTDNTTSPPLVQAMGQSLGNIYYTYAFQETTFSRKLHRYCLEHGFRLFSDPRSHPLEVYRVFRLMPCMKDKERMYPYFKGLVGANINGNLEISSLPFYCVGGAGTHYPTQDALGNPIYPANMRLPKRILGLFPLEKTGNNSFSDLDVQRRLEICGFGGEWFDCRDVEGYLRELGVHLEESPLFPIIHRSPVFGSPEMVSHEPEMSTARGSQGESQKTPQSHLMATDCGIKVMESSQPVSYVLDIESFFKSKSIKLVPAWPC